MEEPLLLHPWRGVDPALQFTIDDEGTLTGITEMGRVTRDVLGLDRLDLKEERRAAQSAALDRWRVSQMREEDGRVALRTHLGPRAEFRLAKRQALGRAMAAQQAADQATLEAFDGQ
jgi:hypothetical protein